MNENPGETPNPLNVNGTKAAEGPTPATPAAAPVATPTPTAADPAVTPTPTTTSEPAPMAEPTPAGTTTVPSLDPDGRPMVKADEPVASEPKKKTGLIIGIIIAAVVLIGGAVAIALMLPNLNKGNAVAAAINKIIRGQGADKVAIKGDISLISNSEDGLVKKLTLTLDSGIMTNSLNHYTSALATFTLQDDKDYTVNVDEMLVEDNSLYLKVEGVVDALEDSEFLNMLIGGYSNDVYDCDIDEDGCEIDEEFDIGYNTVSESTDNSGIMDIIEVVDGEWIRVPLGELSEMAESALDENDTTSCIENALGDLKNHGNETAELYNKYPFIVSTKENVTLPSKNYPVYMVSLDDKNFTDFFNTFINSNITKALSACSGQDESVTIDGEQVSELVSYLPKVYVEVNDKSEFTRLYLETTLEEAELGLVVDLGFSYPQTINISEPTEYTNFTELLQKFMSASYTRETE